MHNAREAPKVILRNFDVLCEYGHYTKELVQDLYIA